MKNILMGIGNRLRRDDGVGNYITDQVKASGWLVLDCGTVPENYTSIIKKERPGNLVLVDAAQMGLAPGEFRLVDYTTIQDEGGGTHALPLYMVINYMKQYVQEKIYFIGIQPGCVEDGEGLTWEVQQKADEVVKKILSGTFPKIPNI